MSTDNDQNDAGLEQIDEAPTHVALLQQKLGFICAPPSAKLLWDRHFSNAERELLGGDLEEAYSGDKTIGMWQRVRGGSADRAVADIASALDLLTEADHRWVIDHGTSADSALAGPAD